MMSRANKIVARLNWGAFDHESHAPQLRSCNYYVYKRNQSLFGCVHIYTIALEWVSIITFRRVRLVAHERMNLVIIVY